MATAIGSYSRESGPVREMLMGIGVFALLVGLFGLASSVAGGFTIIVVGALICWAASSIRQHNVVRW